MALLFLVICWVIFIAAMAQGGPVKMEPEPQPSPIEIESPMTCTNGQIQLDTEYCKANPDICNEFIQN